MNPADQIVLRLALSQPIPDEYMCVHCGAAVEYVTLPPGQPRVIHASDCLWVEACRYTGTDLGAHGVAE